MKLFRYLLLLLLWGVTHSVASAQAPFTKVVIGGALSSSVSYTGLGISAGLSLRKNNLAVIVGPRLSLTNSYRLATGPWGGAAALYYFTSFSPNRRLQGFANLDYQNIFQRPYCPAGNCNTQRIITHEVSLGYGLHYNLAARLAVFNKINIGLYRESLPSRFREAGMQVQGLNMLVNLGLAYTFSNEN